MIPNILHGIQSEKAKSLELLIQLYSNPVLNQAIKEIFSEDRETQISSLSKPIESYLDSWLTQVICASFTNKAGISMDKMQKVFVLRQVELFKQLPAEILLIIAEEIEAIGMIAEQTIFLENDVSNGLYIVASGKVQLFRKNKLLSEIKENGFFGEISLIDHEPRAATAIAKTEGTLLFINQATFNRLIHDLPQVLLAITQVILRYLRISLAKEKLE